MGDNVPTSDTLQFTLRPDNKQFRFTIADKAGRPMAHALLNESGLAHAIGHLMTYLSKMQAATNTAPLGQASGIGKLPAPIPHSRWMFGEGMKSDLMMGFEIQPGAWLSFEMTRDDAQKLSTVLLERLNHPKPDLPSGRPH